MPNVEEDINLDDLYVYISTFVAEHGFGPTVREIGEAVGIRSTAVTYHHLNTLRAQGRVTWQHAKARTIRPVKTEPPAAM